jgi:competence ComEA-like helix-hairpin-helix protein
MSKSSSRKTIVSVLAKAQDFLGATRSEVIVVTVLLVGLLAGIGVKRLSSNSSKNVSQSEITHIIDSLATVETSTYTGTTPDAEPVAALTKADTLRKKTSLFPTSPQKEGITLGKITSGKIKLNTATVQDFMRLPGVGKATAAKILALRQEHKFTRIEDVMRVKGIGKKKFEAMKPFLDL